MKFGQRPCTIVIDCLLLLLIICSLVYLYFPPHLQYKCCGVANASDWFHPSTNWPKSPSTYPSSCCPSTVSDSCTDPYDKVRL